MITGQAATVDPTRVGRPITIIVEVMTERTSIDALNGLFTGANIGKMLVKINEPAR